MGQTLPCVAIQMLEDEEFKLWEKEQFTVEISRCPTLNSVWIVGKRSNLRNTLTETFSINNEIMAKTVQRINELNILNKNNEFYECEYQENIMSFYEVCCTPPLCGFIHHAIYKDTLHSSYLNHTSKNVEKQIRHDNSGIGYHLHNGNASEIYGFIYGFTNDQSRYHIYRIINSQLNIDNDSDILEAPWSMRKRMINFVTNYNDYFENENLKCVTAMDLHKQLFILKSQEQDKTIIEKQSQLSILFN